MYLQACVFIGNRDYFRLRCCLINIADDLQTVHRIMFSFVVDEKKTRNDTNIASPNQSEIKRIAR